MGNNIPGVSSLPNTQVGAVLPWGRRYPVRDVASVLEDLVSLHQEEVRLELWSPFLAAIMGRLLRSNLELEIINSWHG